MKHVSLLVACALLLFIHLTAMPVDTTIPKIQPADSPAVKSEVVVKDSSVNLTLEELAKYNGKDGKPEYIAVNGVIYDVTGVDAWKSGKHEGSKAGTDISKKITNSPHGTSVLKKLKIVGKLIKK